MRRTVDDPEEAGTRRSRRRRFAAMGIAAGLAAAAAGFFAVLPLLRRQGEEDRGAPTPAPAVRPAFTDVTAAAGIRFKHENGATGKFYYPEVMGAGSAFFDYDGDGDLDIFLVNGNRLPPEQPSPDITDALFRNNGDGTFSDVTSQAGVGDPGYGQGCCAADYDGDGDEDLYVTNFGANTLYRNRGDGTFERIDGATAGPGWGQSCAFFDADGDGDLDLYAQNYLVYSIEKSEPWYVPIGDKRVLDYCNPSGYEGEQDRLYRNRGDGAFEDATQESGIVAPRGTGMGLVCADFDDDGDMDIAVANDTRPNFYFQNDGKGRFTEMGLMAGIAFNWEGGVEAFMGMDAGDYDGDGRLDIVVPSLRTEGFTIFRNLGGMFRDTSIVTGLDAATGGVTGFAPVFLDYDADGDLDLFFTAGEVRMGRTPVGADAPFQERYAMRNLLLENRSGRFVDVTELAGPALARRAIFRSCSAGDYDNDGDLDLLVTVLGGEPMLMRNDTKGGAWVGFALRGKPPNRDAIGARLAVSAGGRTQVSQIFAGGSYLGQRDRRQLFGLGAARRVDRLVVRWPDGEEGSYQDPEVGRYHEIRQER